MQASVLRQFLEGGISGRALAEDVHGAMERTGFDTYRLNMSDVTEDFEISSGHLVRLCDAVLAGDLEPESLATIAFGMIASDHFLWDGDSRDGALVGETLYDWSAPEINYPLSISTIEKFRHRLLSGEDTFTRDDIVNEGHPRTMRFDPPAE